MTASGPPNSIRTLVLATLLPLTLSGCFSGSSSSSDDSDRRGVVEGAISIEPGTAVDRTVNNPQAGDGSTNNDLDEAQPLRNPATLGGYANADPDTDPVDYYSANLSPGQRIRLHISDYPGSDEEPVDLDLHLMDEDGHVIASSADHARVEEIQVPSDAGTDTFIIKVTAVEGDSNYILTLGQGLTPAAASTGASTATSQGEFVPGDIIVHFEDDSLQAQGLDVGTMASARSRQLGLEHRGGGPRVGTLMHVPDEAAHQQAMSAMGRGATPETARRGRSQLPAATRRHLDTIAMAKALRRQEDIRDTELNAVYRSQSLPNDEFLDLQWNVPLIDMDEAWSLTASEDEIIVAVIDTEIYADHPDLADKLTADGRDFSPDCDVDGTSIPDGTRFHGTHVAGIVGAATNNNTGIAGIGRDTRIMPMTALCDDGFGTTMSVRESVRYAAGLDDAASQPDRPADIINLSLGGGARSDIDEALYEEVADAGVIVVAASGNDGEARRIYPAAYDHVLSVGAVGADTTRAPYSNFGDSLDLVAPGGNMNQDLTGDGHPDGILSTSAETGSDGSISPNYVFSQGTSMATPHVAGVVALMRSLNPELDVDTLLSWIQAPDSPMTEPLGDAGTGEHDELYGYGLINAADAVRLAEGEAGEPSLRASPRSLTLEVPQGGTESAEFELTMLNDDEQSVDVVEVSGDREWITVEPLDENSERGLETYRVTVDADDRDDGTFRGTVEAEADNGSTARVSVTMTVSEMDARGDEDAGLKYVQLRDASTYSLVKETAVNAEDGRYTYRFTDVDPGDYYVIAGTDNDNDGFICDAGEACGAYPTLDRIERFSVGAGQTVRRDFSTGYRAGLGSSTSLETLGTLERSGGDRSQLRRQQ